VIPDRFTQEQVDQAQRNLDNEFKELRLLREIHRMERIKLRTSQLHELAWARRKLKKEEE
jgi:hypothetical protein